MIEPSTYNVKTGELYYNKKPSLGILITHQDFFKNPVKAHLTQDYRIGMYQASIVFLNQAEIHLSTGFSVKEACDILISIIAHSMARKSLMALIFASRPDQTPAWNATNIAMIEQFFVPQRPEEFSVFETSTTLKLPQFQWN